MNLHHRLVDRSPQWLHQADNMPHLASPGSRPSFLPRLFSSSAFQFKPALESQGPPRIGVAFRSVQFKGSIQRNPRSVKCCYLIAGMSRIPEVERLTEIENTFLSDRETMKVEIWPSIGPGHSIVAFSSKWIQSQSLIKSIADHFNQPNALHFAATYHNVHGLVRTGPESTFLVRSSTPFSTYRLIPSETRPLHFLRHALLKPPAPSAPYGMDHIRLCLHSLRQSIMCSADDTPLRGATRRTCAESESS